MTKPDEDELKAMTVAQRSQLADVLAALTPVQWESPSLCEGWRIREAAAHILMPFRVSIRELFWSLLKVRGGFDAVADRFARRDAAKLSPAELVDALRANVDHPWKPPGAGQLGALSHDVIHGLDITEALGLDPASPPERVGVVLENLTPRQLSGFDVNLAGVRLVATDVDWSLGEGREVSMPAKDALLIVTGRKPVPAAS